MLIFTLDPAVRSGFAIGPAGADRPRSGATTLKKAAEPRENAVRNLGCFLRDQFVMDRPDIIVCLHWMHPIAHKSGDAAILSLLLAGAVHALAGIYGIRVEEPYDATVRKHFIGRASAGDRIETNLAVLRQAIALGYVPRDSRDWDRAAACAAWDFASVHYARKAPRELVLFGAGARG